MRNFFFKIFFLVLFAILNPSGWIGTTDRWVVAHVVQRVGVLVTVDLLVMTVLMMLDRIQNYLHLVPAALATEQAGVDGVLQSSTDL